MNRKSVYLFYIFVVVSTLLIGELFFLNLNNAMSREEQSNKREFVGLVGLPDLALVTETSSVRHRTLSDLFSLYRDDANLREYFPSTFAYSHSHVINNPTEVERSQPLQSRSLKSEK
ncbi:MAG: hypothetical protein K0U38_04390 [Epsilonproteobacteria bacterium]|nr:hypothetical protein [Campylobacterota bacterium]